MDYTFAQSFGELNLSVIINNSNRNCEIKKNMKNNQLKDSEDQKNVLEIFPFLLRLAILGFSYFATIVSLEFRSIRQPRLPRSGLEQTG